jgi:hypothetical protein
VRFFSATFFCARKNASHFSLSGAKKRQLQQNVIEYSKKGIIIENNVFIIIIFDIFVLIEKNKLLNNIIVSIYTKVGPNCARLSLLKSIPVYG